MLGRIAANEYQNYSVLASEEARDAADLAKELSATIAAVTRERDELTLVLARVYLPELTEAALAEAERRTGFRAFTTRRPLDAMAKEEPKLRARLATLEADQQWVEREQLTGPHGTYTRALAEAKDLLDPWEHDCSRFESLDQFLELVTLGYDTPAFEERWWQPQYWRHWAAGDAICAALGLDDFGDDVLPAYEAARAPRDKWRAEIARIQQKITGVHEHVQQHDRVAWRLANLASIYLEEAQKVLAKHIERADVPLLAAWAGDDRGVTIHLKRLSGLTAKLDMLKEMLTGWLEPSRQALVTARNKYSAKAEKLRRPKKGNLDIVMPVGVPDKLHAQRARREKARSQVRRIVRYDAYDRFDLAQPPETWWLHMHDNRRPGVFTPGLRTWYDRHPDIVVVADPLWEADRGDALAATGAMAELGDIS